MMGRRRVVGAECVICDTTEEVIGHHKYGRSVDPLVISMCRTCEGAVHNRNAPRPGTEEAVLRYRAYLPAKCVVVKPSRPTQEHRARGGRTHRAKRRAYLVSLRTLADVVRSEDPETFARFLELAPVVPPVPALND